MKIGAPRFGRRSMSAGAAAVLIMLLAACTGVGGGYLPPTSPAFNGQASFGFSFSCQDAGGINPPTGRLKIQLDYVEHGTNLLGGPFSIHGTVDEIDPVVESAVCIGKNPPPAGSELTFLGRYRPTTSRPPGALASCPARQTSTSPMCRFEVTVKDNDGNLAPSPGDFFSIKLADATPCVDAGCSKLTGTLLYARAGTLAGGNITVK